MEGTNLYLVVEGVRDASTVVWTGAESNTWDVANTENFAMVSDATKANFVNGDKVVFNDDAAIKNVVLNSDIEADSVIFDNTAAYNLSGEGAITGNTVLVKRGTGTTTIRTDNTYTGGTRISGGVLNVNALASDVKNSGNLGANVVLANKMVIENGATLRTAATVTTNSPIKFESEAGGIIENPNDFTANKTLSGTVAYKKGGGTLILTNNNTSLNKLVVVAGTVKNQSITVPAKLVELQGGTLNESTSTSYAISVAKGKSATWNLAERSTYSNKITGEGTLSIYCPLVNGGSWMAARTPVKCNMSEFEGTIKPQKPSKDYRFTLDNSYGLAKGTMDIADGIEVQNTGKTFAIGKVTGTGALGGLVDFGNGVSGYNTWKVGNETSYRWSGKVTGTSTAFVKIGTGKVTVDGNWDNTGSVKVAEGELCLSSGKVIGTGAVVVDKDACLSGVTGTTALSNSSFTINGELVVGAFANATSGKINFGGKNVTISSTGKYVVGKGSYSNTTIENVNTLTINGTVEVVFASSYTPKDGDVVTLWTANKFAGTPNYVLPNLPLGMAWDMSKISEGKLTIVSDPTAIGVVPFGAKYGRNDIYDLKGQLVRKNATSTEGLPSGVYFRNGKKIIVK